MNSQFHYALAHVEALQSDVHAHWVVIDDTRCKGCELCVVCCPEKNLTLASAFNQIGYHPAVFSYHGKKGDCTGCGICYWVCPDFAIAEVRTMKKK